MPYRYAHWVIIGLIAATLLAFWPGYFSQLGEAEIAWHIHGVTASLWMLLLLTQSWSIHAKHRAFHRMAGLAVFLLVPLFTVGGVAVVQTMAAATASGDDIFYNLYGAPLGIYDGLSTIGFVWLAAMAIRERRKVRLHSAYMLATAILLIGPVLSRITDRYIPGIAIETPADFWLFSWHLHASSLVAVGICLWLASRDRANARPWLVAAGLTVAQSLGYATVGQLPAWRDVYIRLADVPVPVLYAIALVGAAAAMWWAWSSVPGAPQRVRPVAA
jgi:uncharacterized membrane protein YozB (DUF420 family)